MCCSGLSLSLHSGITPGRAQPWISHTQGKQPTWLVFYLSGPILPPLIELSQNHTLTGCILFHCQSLCGTNRQVPDKAWFISHNWSSLIYAILKAAPCPCQPSVLWEHLLQLMKTLSPHPKTPLNSTLLCLPAVSPPLSFFWEWSTASTKPRGHGKWCWVELFCVLAYTVRAAVLAHPGGHLSFWHQYLLAE